jgi:hypothetical protein
MGNATVGTRGGSPGRALGIGAVVVAGLAQLVVLVPFTVASGLVAPLWAIVLLYGLWLAGAVLLVRLARRRPLVTPLVPVVNGALLWLAISGGQAWLGWTP